MKTAMNRIGVSSMVLLTSLGVTLIGCPDPEPEVNKIELLISGSQSLTGKYAETSNKTIAGASAAIDWVNNTYGGIKLPDNTLATLKLDYTDDESTGEVVTTNTQAACDDANTNYLLAPYSSGLTSAALAVADTCNKILLDHGGASNSLFETSNNIVASISPAGNYHRAALDAVAAQEATISAVKVAFVYEDTSFTKSVQAGSEAYAAELGFDVVFSGNYPAGAENFGDFDDVVTSLLADPPDVILGGGHAVDGRTFINRLDMEGIAPKMISLLVAPTDPDFYNLTLNCPAPCDYPNHPAEGVSGPSQWEVGVTFNKADAESNGRMWFGPSQEEFLSLYEKYAGVGNTPSYHAANGAAMILSLAKAIEIAQSQETSKVRAALADLDFTSFWGDWSIDEHGANVGHAMVEVQWQEGVKQIVWPEAAQTSPITYPIN